MSRSRTIIVYVRDRTGRLLAGARVGFWLNKDYAGEVPSGEGHASITVDNPQDEVEVNAVYGGVEQKVPLSQSQDSWTFHFDVDPFPHSFIAIMKQKIPLLVGLLLMFTALALGFAYPEPNILQVRLILSTASLAGGLIASEIPGMFNLNMSLGNRLVVGATGALAVFVLLYLQGPGT